MMLAKAPRYESKTLRDSAHGQPCAFRIVGVCNGNPETTVLCHDRRGLLGKSVKPDDFNAGFGCSSCHDVMDGRASKPEGWQPDDLAFYWNRAKAATLRYWFESGTVVVA